MIFVSRPWLILLLLAVPGLAGFLVAQDVKYKGRTAAQWSRVIANTRIRFSDKLTLPSYQEKPRPYNIIESVKSLFGLNFVSTWVCDPLRDGDPHAIPVLLELLRDKDPVVRMYSVETLGAHGEQATRALPELRRLVSDSAFGGFGHTVGQKAELAIRRIEGPQ